jgi:hypothetical protein
LRWRGVHKGDIDLIVLVQELDDFVHLVEVELGVAESEVTAPWQQQVSLIMVVMI